jgi:hypothetical protein
VLCLTARPADRLAAQSSLSISLVTYGPGDEVWEHFGHNAIWVRDSATGENVSYNYGLFDFRQEHFLLRFLQGRMWYAMGGFPGDWYNSIYAAQNRSIWVQDLDLTPEQRVALRDFLRWNAREENRHYFYDYYRDNCTTRVRDAIDRVIGGRIRATIDTILTPTTYRWHTLRLTADDPFIFTGMDLLLGHPADRRITAYEETFLPMRLRDWLRLVKVQRADGSTAPLVRAERTLHTSTRPPMRSEPPHWTPAYLLLGLVLGGGAVALGERARTRPRARRAMAWSLGAWGGIVGVVGMIVAGLWAFTDHAATYQNENVLQANLFALPLAVLLPRALFGGAGARRAALAFAWLAAGTSLLGLALKLLPGFFQHNAEIIALFLPAHVGVLVATLRAR